MLTKYIITFIIIDNDNIKKRLVDNLAESKGDLILHPIRMRIIQLLIGGSRRTTQQISELMPDIPQATMYRHLNKLLKAKIIEIIEQNQIRGSVEKVYVLSEHGADIPTKDLKDMSAEEHMEMFMKFVAMLIGDYGRYLQQDHYDQLKDGISFRQVHLNLTDEEYMQMLLVMRAQVQQHIGNEPNDERRRRIISTIVIPEAK
jgi:DNA-binding transcriptional ArsR family regulator